MANFKRIIAAALLPLFVLTSLGLATLLPQTVLAAPVCYIEDNSYQPARIRVEADCAKTQEAYALYHPNETLPDNACYLFSLSKGTTLPTEPHGSAGDSQTCKDLAAKNTAAASDPSACYNVDVDPKDYTNATKDKYVVLDCNTQAAEITKNSGKPPQPGVCYVFIKNQYKESMTCAALLQKWVLVPKAAAANEAAGITKGEGIKQNTTDNFSSSQCNGQNVDPNKNCIIDDANVVINFLSAGIGVVVIFTIITAGIQYITAGGDPQKVSKAKSRIRDALLALLAFIFLYSFLQWIIPGGFL